MTRDAIFRAADAWFRLTGERVIPGAGDMIKSGARSAVCRLGTDGRRVIAKRCPAATAELERIVYQSILSLHPAAILRFHGVVADEDGYAWVFVDDAAGVAFDPREPTHRSAAAKWLAQLHASAVIPSMALPGKRAGDYAAMLERVSEELESLRAGPTRPDQRQVLVAAVTSQCRQLHDAWPAIARACPDQPGTLVHGDIVTHNARIRSVRDGLLFVPFDWEKAGWGTPAEDISDIALDDYVACARGLGLETSTAALARLAGAGKSFRCLVFLEWLAPELHAGSAAAYDQLQQCRGWLEFVLRERPWSER